METHDARGLAPLPDASFWPVIDVLGGRFWQKTIASAERELARREDEEILRWAETAGLKALELDGAMDFGPDALWAFGATIGKGQAVFDSVLTDASVFDPKWMNDSSLSVLFIGGGALQRHRGGALITTSFTPLHQRLIRLAHHE